MDRLSKCLMLLFLIAPDITIEILHVSRPLLINLPRTDEPVVCCQDCACFSHSELTHVLFIDVKKSATDIACIHHKRGCIGVANCVVYERTRHIMLGKWKLRGPEYGTLLLARFLGVTVIRIIYRLRRNFVMEIINWTENRCICHLDGIIQNFGKPKARMWVVRVDYV